MNSAPIAPISPSRSKLAVAISVCFLSIVFTLPLVQFASELVSVPREWPRALQLIPAFHRAWSTSVPRNATVIQRVVAVNDRLCTELRSYETKVTEAAWIVSAPRDRLQGVLSTWLRSGNEQVVVGPDGWLFFRPDVEALTGNGFLKPAVKRPGITGTPRQTNPIPAIRRLAADLRARGIELLIVPIPSKTAMLGPPTRRENPSSTPIHNSSFDQFLADLRRDRIAVCDLTPTLLDTNSGATSSLYLKTDSHWNPAGVRQAVHVVARQVRTIIPHAGDARSRWTTTRFPVRNVGDTARLLGQNASSPWAIPEGCEITRIVGHDGADWHPESQAEILLLGDSFTNIYSQTELGWGTSAGFAEHLSHVLNSPLDVIALNAGGALASRLELGRQLQAGQDRLAHKKLVIWQFAERELSFGDWRVLPLPKPAAASQPVTTPTETTIEAVIEQIGHLPDPSSLPYREALLPVHLKSVKAVNAVPVPTEIVVYVWGMRDRKLTPLAAWQMGQTVRLKLTPWSQAEKQYGRFARAELDDPDFRLIDLPTYWGEP